MNYLPRVRPLWPLASTRARYIGRVGALTVALGVGMLVSGNSGTAGATGDQSADGSDRGSAAGATGAEAAKVIAGDPSSPHLHRLGSHLNKVIIDSSGGLLHSANIPGAHLPAMRTPKPSVLVTNPGADLTPYSSQNAGTNPRTRQATGPNSTPKTGISLTHVTPRVSLRPRANTAPVHTFANAAPAIQTAIAPTHPIAAFVGGLLAALGMNPNATNGPTPVEPIGQVILGALETARREIEHTFFRPAPVVPSQGIAFSPMVVDGPFPILTVGEGDGAGFTSTGISLSADGNTLAFDVGHEDDGAGLALTQVLVSADGNTLAFDVGHEDDGDGLTSTGISLSADGNTLAFDVGHEDDGAGLALTQVLVSADGNTLAFDVGHEDDGDGLTTTGISLSADGNTLAFDVVV